MTTDSSDASRADIELVHAVTRALVESPALDSSALRVAADAGRVRLTGRVSTHAQRLAAATAAGEVLGVAAVDNEITVGELDLDAARASDDELADAVAHAIAASTVGVSDLRYDVRHRVVTLHGGVASERERGALRRAVEQVAGVHFVDNRIGVEAGEDAIEELDPATCFELLGTAGVGRLGIQEASGVDIFPVDYTVYDDNLYFRSGPGAKMIRLTEAPDVAFEADGHGGEWTWSVVVKGEAKRLDDDAEILRSGISVAPTAHPSDKFNYVRIRPRQVTGRRFRHLT
jgi:osmotically-inducible protein OsmY